MVSSTSKGPGAALLALICVLSAAGTAEGRESVVEGAQALVDAGDLSGAEAALRAALEAEADDSAPGRVRELGLLVQVLRRAGRAHEPETVELARRLVQAAERGDDPGNLATALTALAAVHAERGDPSSAREPSRRALELSDLRREERPVAAAMAWYRHAGILVSLRETAEAVEAYRESAAIFRRGPPEELWRLTIVLNDLAVLFTEAGDLAAAVEAHEESLELKRRLHAPDDVSIAISLNNLANVHAMQGSFSEARPLHEEALPIFREALGSEHPQVAMSLTSLAGLLQMQGDLVTAKGLQRESLAILRKALGERHAEVGLALGNLAIMELESGNAAAASIHAAESLAILGETIGSEQPQYAAALQTQALAWEASGRFAEARPLHERSIALRRSLLGPDHPHLAAGLNDLAVHLEASGELAAAREAHEESLAIRRRNGGPEDPALARGLDNAAGLLLAAGEPRRALHLALEAEAIGRAHLRLIASGWSEREALLYAQRRPSGLATALSAALQIQDTESAALCWRELARSRGLVFEVMAARRRSVSAGPELAPLHAAQRDAAERLARLTVAGPGAAGVDAHRQLLERTRREVERAERELGRASGAPAAMDVELSSLAARLVRREALLAYVHFELSRAKGSEPAPHYAAFLLAGADEQARLVALGPADAIERQVAAWREAVLSRDESEAREQGARLRRLVWDPLAGKIAGVGRLFVVPDGNLHSVNLAALPDAQGRWLVESGPTVHGLSVERDLLAPRRARRAPGGKLLVVGDPDFSAEPWSERPRSRLRTLLGAPASLAALVLLRGDSSTCSSFEGLSFERLPGTAEEARDVERAWRRMGKDLGRREFTRLVGAQASEESVKLLAQRASTLHLATHGFFLGEGCGAAPGSRGVVGSAAAAERAPVENPLLRSGLALAGFNKRSAAPGGSDDGVLTAQEIASLDLAGVEQAVLSACDTGRGDVAAAEGVLGLQRAFRIAGARRLVMSLWPVADRETRDWMRALYAARLEQGRSADEAVREASRSLLEQRRRQGLSESPFYWAAFVVSGEPG